MCGFLGFVNNGIDKSKAEKVGLLMLENIKHRGPDAQRVWGNDDVTLGFARLSFQDVEHGHQPMFLNDKSKCILFNGEIYNFQEIKKEIQAEVEQLKKQDFGKIKINLNNLKFATDGDTEIILIGYELWGEKILNKLRGMFAFAIYDFNKKEFFFARDNFGIKPFYYYFPPPKLGGARGGKEWPHPQSFSKEEGGVDFMFASEIKAFLPHPNFEKEFNEKLLPSYLTFGCVPATIDETFFKNVFKLPPAHYAIYNLNNNSLEIKKYWEVKFEINKEKRFEEYVKEIEQTFSESVSKHMIADKSIEVGAFLSGGVDSAYTVAEVAKHTDVQTFTIGFTEEKFSEASEARHTANLLNVKNTEVKVDASDYLKNVKKVQWHMDEPLSNPSANLLFELAKETSKHLKAVLSGEGADEMFAGYNVYKEPLALEKYQKLPLIIRRLLSYVFTKFNLPGKNFINRGAKSVEERYIGNSNIFSLDDQKKVLQEKYFDENWNPLNETKKVWNILSDVLNPSLKKGVGGFDIQSLEHIPPLAPPKLGGEENIGELDDISKMQFLDIHMWMVQEILLKADKMSMAHSLELRVPFLDKEIWNIGRTIPQKYKVSSKNTKLALRAAANKMLDKVSSDRKKKAFPSPLPEWLNREDYYQKIKKEFESEIAKKYFNTNYLIQILNEHKESKKNNVRKIWTIYTFIIWYNQFFN